MDRGVGQALFAAASVSVAVLLARRSRGGTAREPTQQAPLQRKPEAHRNAQAVDARPHSPTGGRGERTAHGGVPRPPRSAAAATLHGGVTASAGASARVTAGDAAAGSGEHEHVSLLGDTEAAVRRAVEAARVARLRAAPSIANSLTHQVDRAASSRRMLGAPGGASNPAAAAAAPGPSAMSVSTAAGPGSAASTGSPRSPSQATSPTSSGVVSVSPRRVPRHPSLPSENSAWSGGSGSHSSPQRRRPRRAVSRSPMNDMPRPVSAASSVASPNSSVVSAAAKLHASHRGSATEDDEPLFYARLMGTAPASTVDSFSLASGSHARVVSVDDITLSNKSARRHHRRSYTGGSTATGGSSTVGAAVADAQVLRGEADEPTTDAADGEAPERGQGHGPRGIMQGGGVVSSGARGAGGGIAGGDTAAGMRVPSPPHGSDSGVSGTSPSLTGTNPSRGRLSPASQRGVGHQRSRSRDGSGSGSLTSPDWRGPLGFHGPRWSPLASASVGAPGAHARRGGGTPESAPVRSYTPHALLSPTDCSRPTVLIPGGAVTPGASGVGTDSVISSIGGTPRIGSRRGHGTGPSSVVSTGSRFSPFRRHAEAGGSPMSSRARQLWKTFFHKASSLINATKTMSKKPPMSRKWSKGQLTRRGSWRRFLLQPPMRRLMSHRLLDPHASVPLDASIAWGTLNNGMQYYVAPNPSPKEHVIVRLVLRVGSLQEEEAECGLARFIERMSVRGTATWSHDKLVGYVHRASALGESGYDSNTTVQDTWFQLAISAHSPKHLEEGLEYLSQLPVSLRCSDEDVEDERHLYLQDWRSMQGAPKVMADTYWHTLFKGSRYADRMPMGRLQVVRDAEPSAVRAFYRRWYRPDLMAIVVAGDMPSRSGMVTLVHKYFGAIPTPNSALPSGVVTALARGSEAAAAAVGAMADVHAIPRRSRDRHAGVARLPRFDELAEAAGSGSGSAASPAMSKHSSGAAAAATAATDGGGVEVGAGTGAAGAGAGDRDVDAITADAVSVSSGDDGESEADALSAQQSRRSSDHTVRAALDFDAVSTNTVSGAVKGGSGGAGDSEAATDTGQGNGAGARRSRSIRSAFALDSDGLASPPVAIPPVPAAQPAPSMLLRHATLPNMAGTRFLELPNLDAVCSHVMVEFILPFSVFPTLAAKRRAMAADLFVSAFERRLQAIQRTLKAPLFEAALVDRDMLLRELCRFTITLQVPDGADAVARALEVALLALEEVKVRGFAGHEVQAAKAAREIDLSAALAEGTERDSFTLTELCTQHFLHDGQTLLMSSLDETRAEQVLLAAITSTELAAVARTLRLGYGCRVLWQHTAEHGYQLLGTDALKAAVHSIKVRTSSERWVPGRIAAPSPRLPGAALPGKLNISAAPGDVVMKRDVTVDISEWYLGNDITVVTCAGATDEDDVHLRCVAPGGVSELEGPVVKAAALSCFAMELAGLGDLNTDELEAALDGHAISFRQSIHGQYRCIDAHGGSQDLELLLALLHMAFRTRPVTQPQLDEAVDTMRGLVAQQRLAPEFAFMRTVGALSEGRRVLARNPSFMRLAAPPQLDAVNAVQHAAFSDPSEFVLVLAGALPSPQRMRTLLAKFVANIRPCTAASPAHSAASSSAAAGPQSPTKLSAGGADSVVLAPAPRSRTATTRGSGGGSRTGTGAGSGAGAGAGTGGHGGSGRTLVSGTGGGTGSHDSGSGEAGIAAGGEEPSQVQAPGWWALVAQHRTTGSPHDTDNGATASPTPDGVRHGAPGADVASTAAPRDSLARIKSLPPRHHSPPVKPATSRSPLPPTSGPRRRPPPVVRHRVRPSPAVFPRGVVRKTVRRGMASRSCVNIMFPARLSPADPTAPLFLAHRAACEVLKVALVREHTTSGLAVVSVGVELVVDVLDLPAARAVVTFLCHPRDGDAAITATLRVVGRLQHEGCGGAEVQRALNTLQRRRNALMATQGPVSPAPRSPGGAESMAGSVHGDDASMGSPSSASGTATTRDQSIARTPGQQLMHVVSGVTMAALWARTWQPPNTSHTHFEDGMALLLSSYNSAKIATLVTPRAVSRAAQDAFPVAHNAAVTLAPDVHGSMTDIIM